jgi:hypothetical protein
MEQAHLTFNPGDHVRIKKSIRSPYAGQSGIVFQLEPGGDEMEYLVRFADGLVFRYDAAEMETEPQLQ